MNAISEARSEKKPPINYWRLWLFNAVLVSTGVLFFLTVQYGTYEFFGRACLMALLPFIAAMVLVGGAGSTLFVLTKVMIEKRSLKTPTALVLLTGPGVVLTLLLGLLGASKSPAHRLAFICMGDAPASASHVRVTGYSTFLRSEWLAVFNVGQKDFQTMVAKANLVPVDGFEFRNLIEQSALKKTRLYQSLPPLNDALYYRRVFKKNEDHKLGSILAVFDQATSTAVVWRGYRD